MDDDRLDLFDGASALLTDVVRTHARGLPAAEIRRRGRARRHHRAAAVAGTAVLALLVAGGAHAAGVGSARPAVQQPADSTDDAVAAERSFRVLLPPEALQAHVGGSAWSVVDSATAQGPVSGLASCGLSDVPTDDGGSPVVRYYSNGHDGLSELVSRYSFDAAAVSAFVHVVKALAACSGTPWSPRNLGNTDTDSAWFVVVQQGQGIAKDPTKLNHVSVRRQGSLLVVLDKREPVTGALPSTPPGAPDPLATAMTAAVKRAYH